MPECINCKWLKDRQCSAWLADWPDVPVNHIRACVVAINEEYRHLIKEGMRVLEIGCGTWSPIFDHCQEVGAHWEGIDVSDTYYGKPTIATRIESVEDLSFDNQSFDFVIGNQSIEHWVENGTGMQIGLWQCFRVCKTGGQVIMNLPIHNHGSQIFVEGDLQELRSIFELYAEDVSIETWRKNPAPLQTIKLLPERFTSGKNSMYVVDVRATRGGTIGECPSPFHIKKRLFRELIDHRLDYVLYKLWRRIRN